MKVTQIPTIMLEIVISEHKNTAAVRPPVVHAAFLGVNKTIELTHPSRTNFLKENIISRRLCMFHQPFHNNGRKLKGHRRAPKFQKAVGEEMGKISYSETSWLSRTVRQQLRTSRSSDKVAAFALSFSSQEGGDLTDIQTANNVIQISRSERNSYCF